VVPELEQELKQLHVRVESWEVLEVGHGTVSTLEGNTVCELAVCSTQDSQLFLQEVPDKLGTPYKNKKH
jgi:hypothetical protein